MWDPIIVEYNLEDINHLTDLSCINDDTDISDYLDYKLFEDNVANIKEKSSLRPRY